MSNSSVDKMKSKKSLKKIPNYAKNLVKSTTFAAGDFFKETMPNVASFVETNSEFNRGMIRSIRNHKQIYKNTKKMIMDSKSVYALKQMKRNAISDLKTGKLYNQARKDKTNLESAGWGDMFEEDDFFKDDFSNMEPSEMSTDDIVKQSTDMLGGAIISGTNTSVATIKSASNSIISANADMTDSIVTSNANNTTRAILNESRLFNELGDKLQKIHETSLNISNNTSNATNYYNKNMELTEKMFNVVNELGANVKELLDIKREQYKEYNESRQNKYEEDSSPFSSGSFDIKKYINNVKKNMSNELNNAFGGMNSFFGEDGNMLLAFAGSPLEFIPKMLLSKVAGAGIKKSMKHFDDTFKSFMENSMSKFTDFLTKKGDSMGTNILGNIFGIQKGTKEYIDSSKYVKGATPFDGVTKRAITDVIPTYLRKILSALTNTDEMIYNFNSGSFSTIKDIKKNYEDNLENSYTSSFYKVNSDIMNTLNESLGLSEKASKEYSDMLVSMEKAFAESGKFFNPKKLKTANQLRDAGIYDINATDDTYQTLIRTINNFGPDMWNKFNDNIRKSSKNKDSFIKDLNENMGVTGESALFNGFDADKKIKQADKFGQTYHDYLRNIYKLLVHGIKTFPENTSVKFSRRHNRNRESSSSSYFNTISNEMAAEEDEVERKKAEKEREENPQDDPNKINNVNDLMRRHNVNRENVNNLVNSSVDEYLTRRYGSDYNLRINNLSQLGMAEIQRHIPQGENKGIFAQLKESFNTALEVPRQIGQSFLDNARITMNNFLYGDDEEHNVSLLQRFNDKVQELSQKIVNGFNDKIFKPLGEFIGKLKLNEKLDSAKNKIKEKYNNVKNTLLDGQSSHLALFANKMFGSKAETMSSRDFYNSYIKNNTGGMKKGAAIGAVASLFTPFGLVGGTLLGGSLGTFASSETFKKKMFGELGSDGKRKGGLISKSTMTKFEKMMPTLKKSVGIGAAASLFTPFGLVGGALLGGTIGFGSHLNGVQEFLFGKKDKHGNVDDSKALIKQAWVKRFKEMLPGMKIGGSVGLLSSIFMPYGPIGGAVLGLTTSIIGQNKTVKRFLFGDYDPKTNKGKTGLFQKIGMFFRAEILNPIKTYTQYMIGKGKNWITENITNPFLESLEPLKKQFEIMKDAFKEQIKSGWQSTKDFIGGVFEKHVGKPFGELMEEKFINPMKNMFKKLFGGLGRIIGGVIKSPVTLLHKAAMGAMDKHIKNGNADYLEKWKEKKKERDEKLAKRKAEVQAKYEARKKRDEEISQLLKDGKYDLRSKDTQKARAMLGMGIDIKDTINKSTSSVKDAIFKTNGILDKMANTINNIFGQVKNFANEKIKDTKDKIKEQSDKIKEQGGLKQVASDKYNHFVESVKSFFDRSDNNTSTKLDENRNTAEKGNTILSDIKAKLSEFKDKVKNKITDTKNNISNKISNNGSGYTPNGNDSNVPNIVENAINGNNNKSSKNKKKGNGTNNNVSDKNKKLEDSKPKKKSLIYDDSLSTTNKYLAKIYDNVDGQIRNVGYNTMYIKKLLVRKFGKLKGKDLLNDPIHRIRSIFSKPKEFIKRIFGVPINFIKGTVEKVKNFGSSIVQLPKTILVTLGKGLGSIGKMLKGALSIAFKVGKGVLKEAYGAFKFFGKEMLSTAKFIGKELYGAVKFIGKEVYGAVKFIGKGMLKTAGFVAKNALSILGSFTGKVLSGLGSLAGKLLKGVGVLVDIGGKLLKGAFNIIKGITGGIMKGVIGTGKFIARGLGFGRKNKTNVSYVKLVDTVNKVKRVEDPIFKKMYDRLGEIFKTENKIFTSLRGGKKKGKNVSPVTDGGELLSRAKNTFNKIRSNVGKIAKIEGSHRNGLGFVPRDGYVAELHRGERVLTRRENQRYSSRNNDSSVSNISLMPLRAVTNGIGSVLHTMSLLKGTTLKYFPTTMNALSSGIKVIMSSVGMVAKGYGKLLKPFLLGMGRLGKKSFGVGKSIFGSLFGKNNTDKPGKDGNMESIEKHFKQKSDEVNGKRNNRLFNNNNKITDSTTSIYKLLSKTYSKKGLLGLAVTGILGAIKWVKEKGFNKLKDLLFGLISKIPLPSFLGSAEHKIERKVEQGAAKHVVEKAGQKVVEKEVAEHAGGKVVQHEASKLAERGIASQAEHAVAKAAEKKTVKSVFKSGVKKVAESKAGLSLKTLLTKIFESPAMKKACGSKLATCLKDVAKFLAEKLAVHAAELTTKIAAKWGVLTASGTVSAFLVPAIWYGTEMSLGVAETKKIFKISPNSKPTAMMRLVGGLTRLINNNITFGFINMHTIAMFIGRMVFNDEDNQVILQGQEQLNNEFSDAKANGETDAQTLDDYNYEKNKTLVDRAGDGIAKGWRKTKEFGGKVVDGISNTWDKTKQGASNLWNSTKQGASNLWNSTKQGASNLWNGAKELGGDIKDGAVELWGSTKEGMHKLYDGAKDALITTDAIFGTIFNLTDDNGKPITLSMWTKNKASKAWDKIKEFGGEVKDKAAELWGKTKDGVKSAVESIDDGLKAMNEGIGNALGLKDENGNPMTLTAYTKSKVTSAWSSIKDTASGALGHAKNLWSTTKSRLGDAVDSIEAGAKSMYDNISDALGLKDESGNRISLIDYAKSKAKSAFNKVGEVVNTVKDLAGSVWGSIKDKFKQIKDNIGEGLNHLDQTVGSTLGFTDENGNPVGFIDGVKNKVSSIWGNFHTGTVERKEAFNAQGGGNGGNQRRNHGYVNNKIRGGMGTSNQFSQNDPRWANIPYGDSGTLGSSGCGPMAAASALSTLTGNDISPLDTMQYALQNGYRDYSVGTTWDYFNNIGNQYGVNMEQTTDYKSTVLNALKQGKPVIIAGRGGRPFTDTGHYIVGKGVDSSGNVIVNDPESNDSENVYKFNDIFSNANQAWVTGGNNNTGNLNDVPDIYGFGPGGSDAATATKVMNAALGVVGTPYVWGGKGEQLTRGLISSLQRQYPGNRYSVSDKFYDGKHIAVDCSGLVGYAYRQAGINIPAGTSGQLSDTSHAVNPNSPIHPADLLYPKRGHVVMALGGNKIVHAPKTGDYVKVQDLYFKPQFIRRYLPNTEGAVPNMSGIGSGATIGGGASSDGGATQVQERPKTLMEKLADAKSDIGKLMGGFVTSSMLGKDFSQAEIDNILNPNPQPTGGVNSGGSFNAGPVGSAGKLNPSIDKYNDLFNKYGKQYGVDPNIMKAIAMQESGGDIRCGYPNHAAWGLMQIENTLKADFAKYGQQHRGKAFTLMDRLDPDKAIEYSMYRFSNNLKRYHGDYAKTIQAQNFSEYSVDALIRAKGDRWKDFRAQVGQYNGTHAKRYGDPKYIEHVVRYYTGQNSAINALKGGHGKANKSQFRASASFKKNKNKQGGFGANKITPIKYNIFDKHDNIDSFTGVSSLPINEYTSILNTIDNSNSSSGSRTYDAKLDIIIKLLFSIFSNSDGIKQILSEFNNSFTLFSKDNKSKNENNAQSEQSTNNSNRPIVVSSSNTNNKTTGINKAYENAKMIARGIF